MSTAVASFGASDVLQHKDLDPWVKVPQSQFGAAYVRRDQGDRSPFGKEKYLQYFDFPAPAFGSKSTVLLPAIPMQVEEMYVEMILSAPAGTTAPAYVLAPAFLDLADGASISYLGNRVYNMTEPESVVEHYLMTEENEAIQHWVASNDQDRATRITNSAALFPVNLSLRPIANKIFSKMPPLASFAPNSWSVSINLKAAARVIDGTSTAAGTGTVTSMRLVLVGHRVAPSEIEVQRNYLREGVGWHYVEANHRRETVAASASDFTITLSELEGNASDMTQVLRKKSEWDGALGDALNPIAWEPINGNADTLEIGRISNPVELYGQAVIDRQLRNIMQRSYPNGWTYLDAEATRRQLQITATPFAEAVSGDYALGLSSGSYPLNNDLRVKYNFGSTTIAQVYWDVLVGIQKFGVISHDGWVTNNSK